MKTTQEIRDHGLNRLNAGWFLVIHLGALLVFIPSLFSIEGVGLAFALYYITGTGVTLGYHRLLTHPTFKTYKPVKWFAAWVGSLSGEGGPIDWVAVHRRHHQCSDKEGDPHSPVHGDAGFGYGHMGWMLSKKQKKERPKLWAAHARDLLADPVIRFIDRYFFFSHVLLTCAVFLAGLLLGDMQLGLSLVVWGVFFRMVFVFHSTWAVNSLSHMCGYRNYDTEDNSRNNWLVALLAIGEGWHNNHHHCPTAANHGHRWWEYDPTFRAIQLLGYTGLAWNVIYFKYNPTIEKKKGTVQVLFEH